MKYMLDTDVCVACLRGNSDALSKVKLHEAANYALSVITVCELLYGARKGKRPQGETETLEFIDFFHVVSYDQQVAREYADIRCHLEAQGTPIGSEDLFIAAHARYLGLSLVTRNLREFQRVPYLLVETW
jgi:tRNA(fMet)-specific endonuclease VapC